MDPVSLGQMHLTTCQARVDQLEQYQVYNKGCKRKPPRDSALTKGGPMGKGCPCQAGDTDDPGAAASICPTMFGEMKSCLMMIRHRG